MSDEQNRDKLTLGEQQQIERIEKFSKNKDEIKRVRTKLLSAGYGDTKPKESADTKTFVQQDLPRAPKDNPARRFEDQIVFAGYQCGFFKSLLYLLSNSSALKKKYGNSKFVKPSLLSLLFTGCAFRLGEKANRFVFDYLFKWQEQFRKVLIAVYSAGWRDEAGRLILSPLEYNMLSTAQRLAAERSIAEILYAPNNSRVLYRKTHVFIYYYYEVVKSHPALLGTSFLKSVGRLLSDEFEEVKNQRDDYADFLTDFFDGRVEHNFIIPLLECVSGEPWEREALRREARVTLLSAEEYKADEKIQIVMQARKEKYEAEIKKRQERIETEIKFLDRVIPDLNLTYEFRDEEYSSVGRALHIVNARPQMDPAYRKHTIKDINALIQFFIDNYESVLCSSVLFFREGGIEQVQIFTPTVFEGTMKLLQSLRRDLENFFAPEFSQPLSEYPGNDEATSELLKLLGQICDYFLSVGLKLQKAMSVTSSKPSYRPLDALMLGKLPLPFVDFRIFIASESDKKNSEFTLHGAYIWDTVRDIRVFCFDFVRHYEPVFRYVPADRLIRKTLNHRLEHKSQLYPLLDKLKAGEDVDLPYEM